VAIELGGAQGGAECVGLAEKRRLTRSAVSAILQAHGAVIKWAQVPSKTPFFLISDDVNEARVLLSFKIDALVLRKIHRRARNE